MKYIIIYADQGSVNTDMYIDPAIQIIERDANILYLKKSRQDGRLKLEFGVDGEISKDQFQGLRLSDAIESINLIK